MTFRPMDPVMTFRPVTESQLDQVRETVEIARKLVQELVQERDRYRAALEGICNLPERYGFGAGYLNDSTIVQYAQGQAATEAIRLAKCALRYLGETK